MADHRPELRIVLVDDHAHLLQSLAEFLGDEGIEVVEAAMDGAQALQACDRAIHQYGRIDAVVMDYRMPGMDGLTAARHLHARYPGLPVVLHTAFADLLGDAPEAAGVAAQVAKGADSGELSAAIRRVAAPLPDASLADRACPAAHRGRRATVQT